MSKKKTVAIEKGGVRAEATELTLAGLLEHGWTVVDDGDKAQPKATAKDAQKLAQQKLFGSNEEE